MGFGILFRLDESSLGSHLNERRVRGEEEAIHEDEQTDSFREISNSGSDSENEVLGENTLDSSDVTDFSSERATLEVSSLAVSTEITVQLDSSDEKITSVNVSGNYKVNDSFSKSSATIELEDFLDRTLELGSAKSYGLQPSQEEIVKELEPHQRDKPYLSKAERRKLKKGQKEGAIGSPAENEKEFEESHHPVSQPVRDVKISKPGSGKNSRGQRGKLKKIKEKYADQDEEERSIRMALLAAAGKSKKNTEKPADEKTTVDKVTKPTSDASKICYKCKKAGHTSRECPEHPDESQRSKSGGEVDRSEGEMEKVNMEEDDIHEIEEEEKEKLNDVDYLTGNPLVNDILLYAVPMCGPYNALQSYKYRVKIIPGTMKKRKAAKSAMNLFSHMAEATSREKELMKGCTDPELVAAIIGNVKVSAAGLTQLHQKKKKSKKSDKAES